MKIRKSSRALLLNEKGHILLIKFEFKNVRGNKVLWVTPGGGVKKGESPSQTLIRELHEELGLIIVIEDEPIFEKEVLIEGKDGDFISREKYYLIKINSNTTLAFENQTLNEKNSWQGSRWWSKEELTELDKYAPKEILNFL